MKSLWEDVTNGIAIPPEFPNLKDQRMSNEYLFWMIACQRLDYEEKAESGSTSRWYDPYQIWPVVDYLSTYDTDEDNIFLRYHGEKGSWKLGIRQIASVFKGQYGCMVKKDVNGIKRDMIDPWDKDKALVKEGCKKSKGKFVDLEKWYLEHLTGIIEERLSDTKREMNPKSLKNLKQFKKQK